MKTWVDIGFEIEITGDGSPSLRLIQPPAPDRDRGESMHHSGGACAETLLIYSAPIADLLKKKNKDLSFLVVGLGLGYIELCIARECRLAGLEPSAIKNLISYESVPELREFFWLWLQEQKESVHSEVWQTYESVLNFVIKDTKLKATELKDFLKYHFQSVEQVQGALDTETVLSEKVQGILYDAFSSKTTPHLWDESFLEDFLSKTADSICVFSTYACRASLKRALQKTGFDVQVRPGFQGKRNSTLAWKKNS